MRTPKPRPARKGQSLINWVRFKKGIKDDHLVIRSETPNESSETTIITSHKVENYIYNMSDKEFQEAIEYNG